MPIPAVGSSSSLAYGQPGQMRSSASYDRDFSKNALNSARNSSNAGRGQADRIIPDRGYADKSQSDRPPVDKGYSDRRFQDKGYPERKSPGRDQSERGFPERGPHERGYSDRGYQEKGHIDRGYQEKGYADRGYQEKGHTDRGYQEKGHTDRGYQEKGYNNRGFQEKGYSDRAYQEKGYSDRGNPEKGQSDRRTPEKGYSDRLPTSGRAQSDRGYPEKGYSEKGQMDRRYAEKGYTDRRYSEKGYAEKDNTDGRYTEHVTSDRGYPDRGPSERPRSGLGTGQRRPSSRSRSGHRHSEDMEVDEDAQRVAASTQNKKKKKRKFPITCNISGTRYDIIRQAVEQLGFTVSKEDDPNCYMIWNDSFVSTERISELKPYQRINHFPGMGEICRKDCLARNMVKISKEHPEDFSFIPKTWIFPSEYSSFINYARELKKKKKTKTFIVKPSNGAMGNGIQLYRNAEKVPQNDHTIVQEYIDKPFLVDGYKCDMRIYVLVTSCDPLRIFLYNDGLLRMSTEKYTNPSDNNADQLFMHLTNYSVNKHNENYEKSATTDSGSKRSLKYFNDYLRQHDYDVGYLWKNITEIIIKTLVVAHPHVLHAYRMCRPGQPPGGDSVCFEVLGFDIMLDRKLRPWLLEINRSPSFGTDERIDYEIKSGVIEDALRLLNIKASDKRKNMAAQKAEAQKRLLKPTRRAEGDVSELEKKRVTMEKKKDDLKDMLIRLRKEASREDYENRHCGRFKRIFPPDDKFRKEKYATLLSEAFGVFLSGRAGALQQEIQRTYNNALREEDIMDMLSQCEADEQTGKLGLTRGQRGPKEEVRVKSAAGPKALQSMPVLSRDSYEQLEDDDAEESGSDGETKSTAKNRSGSTGAHSGKSTTRSRVRLNRPSSSNKLGMLNDMGYDGMMEGSDQEDVLVQRALVSLNEMRIKFPGKTDDEAEYILDKLHENWKFHKPRIASYWLVKLDSIKRRKVIDIVRSNVRAVLQRTWKSTDVDSLRLYRIVGRVFNRLLWSHGQGLWNCFQSSGNSWETIFSKSSDNISNAEMACCRRIVQLCRDCLLIVYQFAAEAKSAAGNSNTAGDTAPHSTGRAPSTLDKEKGNWAPPHMVSQRMSRLYNSRSQSLNSLNYGIS